MRVPLQVILIVLYESWELPYAIHWLNFGSFTALYLKQENSLPPLLLILSLSCYCICIQDEVFQGQVTQFIDE